VTVRPVSVFPFASFVVAVSCVDAPAWMVAVSGATVTDATGACTTVTVVVPFFPSLVAVMVACPMAFAVSTAVVAPFDDTVATDSLLLNHSTLRPLSAFPLASFGVAVSVIWSPIVTDGFAGEMSMLATATEATLIVAKPVCPPLLAEMTAEPWAFAVTSPLPDTDATPSLLLDHVTVRPVSALPFASFGVADSCFVSPTFRFAELGSTSTDATGTACTVIVAWPLLPSLVAVIVAVPCATPVTTPEDETRAMLV